MVRGCARKVESPPLGIHDGLGTSAYYGVLGVNHGIGGLFWKRQASLADALDYYAAAVSAPFYCKQTRLPRDPALFEWP